MAGKEIKLCDGFLKRGCDRSFIPNLIPENSKWKSVSSAELSKPTLYPNSASEEQFA